MKMNLKWTRIQKPNQIKRRIISLVFNDFSVKNKYCFSQLIIFVLILDTQCNIIKWINLDKFSLRQYVT